MTVITANKISGIDNSYRSKLGIPKRQMLLAFERVTKIPLNGRRLDYRQYYRLSKIIYI